MKSGLLRGSKLLGTSEIPMDVWALFVDMLDRPDIEIENALEIVEKAVSGAIDMNSEFNLFGYDFAIKQGRIKVMHQRAKKELFIDFSGGREDKSDMGIPGGISVDVVSFKADAMKEAKSEYECLFDDAELQSAISTIQALNDDFVTEYQVDLIALLKKAVRGIPQAVLKLKEICDEMPCVAEQIKVVLTSGVPAEECFG